MPGSYRPHRCTSAAAGHPALRSRIADTIADHIEEHGQRPVARELGVGAGSTIGRWGSDLNAWPSLPLLDLGVRHRPLRDAILAYMDGETPPQGESVRAPGALMGELELTSKLTGEIAKALQDGRVTATEARLFLTLLTELKQHHEAVLIPALIACAEAG